MADFETHSELHFTSAQQVVLDTGNRKNYLAVTLKNKIKIRIWIKISKRMRFWILCFTTPSIWITFFWKREAFKRQNFYLFCSIKISKSAFLVLFQKAGFLSNFLKYKIDSWAKKLQCINLRIKKFTMCQKLSRKFYHVSDFKSNFSQCVRFWIKVFGCF